MRAIIVILIIALAVVSYNWWQDHKELKAQYAELHGAVTSGLESVQPHFTSNIRPEGMWGDEFEDYLWYERGMSPPGVSPQDWFDPNICLEVSEVIVPGKPIEGQVIPIVIKTIPNASLDVEISYDRAVGEEGWEGKTELRNYVNASADGEVTVYWLIPENLHYIADFSSVGISIDAYPPQREVYETRGANWEELPVATHWYAVFFVHLLHWHP